MSQPDQNNWPFEAAKNTAVFTSRFVLENDHPILHVTHDADDGAWQFHSGDVVKQSDARIIALSEALDIDPSLRDLADLPEGWKATREDRRVSWKRSPNA